MNLKIVVIGCGSISKYWFDPLQGMPDVSIVGLVDLFEESAAKKKAEYQLIDAKIGTDLQAMLRETQPDIVFDCTVPEARGLVVQTALRHGCHVLSEKPMATSMNEAHQLIRAAQEAKRIFAIMQNRRFNPNIGALRKFLDTGAIGELTTLNGDFYIGAHFGGFRDAMPHVLLLDMAIHSFDQARVISGADPVTVYCHEWNPRGSWYLRDASAIALFEMSNGVVYTYRGSWCSEGLSTTWGCDWRAIGTRGTVTWDGADKFDAKSVEKDEGFTRPMMSIPVPAPDSVGAIGHSGCIAHFLDCVRSGRDPETICTENIKSLAMVFSAIESAQQGRRVPVKI